MDDEPVANTPPPPSAEALDEAESRDEEVETILDAGPRSAARAGAFAFLALAVILGAAAHFHFSTLGGAAYLSRLDNALLDHAELSLAAMEADGPTVVAPSWPLGFYETLRRDILVYTALVALAAYLWSVSARARARRDAFLVHDKLAAELAELRTRLDGGAPADESAPDTKG